MNESGGVWECEIGRRGASEQPWHLVVWASYKERRKWSVDIIGRADRALIPVEPPKKIQYVQHSLTHWCPRRFLVLCCITDGIELCGSYWCRGPSGKKGGRTHGATRYARTKTSEPRWQLPCVAAVLRPRAEKNSNVYQTLARNQSRAPFNSVPIWSYHSPPHDLILPAPMFHLS